jgi:hypothetical protein
LGVGVPGFVGFFLCFFEGTSNKDKDCAFAAGTAFDLETDAGQVPDQSFELFRRLRGILVGCTEEDNVVCLDRVWRRGLSTLIKDTVERGALGCGRGGYIDGGFGGGADGDVDGFGHGGNAVLGEVNEEFEGGGRSGSMEGAL